MNTFFKRFASILLACMVALSSFLYVIAQEGSESSPADTSGAVADIADPGSENPNSPEEPNTETEEAEEENAPAADLPAETEAQTDPEKQPELSAAAAAISPMALVDENPPELVSVSVDKTSITSPGSFKVTVEATDDVSGVQNAKVYFSLINPPGNVGLHRTSFWEDIEIFQSGTGSVEIQIPGNIVPGEYTCTSVEICDYTGNRQKYVNVLPSPADPSLKQLPNSANITVTGRMKPAELGITVSQPTVSSPGTMIATVPRSQGTYDVTYVGYSFKNKNGNDEFFYESFIDKFTDTLSIDVPYGLPAGEYILYEAEIEYDFSYQTYYSQTHPDASVALDNIIPNEMSVTVTASSVDTTPPTLVSASVTPASVRPHYNDKVTLALQIADDLSGIYRIDYYFAGPLDEFFSNWVCSPKIKDGIFTDVFKMDSSVAEGQYKLSYLMLSDYAGNTQYYFASASNPSYDASRGDLVLTAAQAVSFIVDPNAPKQTKSAVIIKNNLAAVDYSPKSFPSYLDIYLDTDPIRRFEEYYEIPQNANVWYYDFTVDPFLISSDTFTLTLGIQEENVFSNPNQVKIYRYTNDGLIDATSEFIYSNTAQIIPGWYTKTKRLDAYIISDQPIAKRSTPPPPGAPIILGNDLAAFTFLQGDSSDFYPSLEVDSCVDRIDIYYEIPTDAEIWYYTFYPSSLPKEVKTVLTLGIQQKNKMSDPQNARIYRYESYDELIDITDQFVYSKTDYAIEGWSAQLDYFDSYIVSDKPLVLKTQQPPHAGAVPMPNPLNFYKSSGSPLTNNLGQPVTNASSVPGEIIINDILPGTSAYIEFFNNSTSAAVTLESGKTVNLKHVIGGYDYFKPTIVISGPGKDYINYVTAVSEVKLGNNSSRNPYIIISSKGKTILNDQTATASILYTAQANSPANLQDSSWIKGDQIKLDITINFKGYPLVNNTYDALQTASIKFNAPTAPSHFYTPLRTTETIKVLGGLDAIEAKYNIPNSATVWCYDFSDRPTIPSATLTLGMQSQGQIQNPQGAYVYEVVNGNTLQNVTSKFKYSASTQPIAGWSSTTSKLSFYLVSDQELKLKNSTTPTPTPNPGGGSSGGGGGGGGGGGRSGGGGGGGGGTPVVKDITANTVTKNIANAVNNSITYATTNKVSTVSNTITVKVGSEMSTSTIASIAKSIKEATDKVKQTAAVTLKVSVEKHEGQKLQYAVAFSPVAFDLNKYNPVNPQTGKPAVATPANVKFGMTLDNKALETSLGKYYTNTLKILKFDQVGTFGMPVTVTARVDLSKLNTQTLVFYAYDKSKNTITLIANPQYSYKDGLLTFTTDVGNYVVVTDRVLQRK